MRFPVPSRKFVTRLRGPFLIGVMLGLLLLASHLAAPSVGRYGLEVLSPSDRESTVASASQTTPSPTSVPAIGETTVFIASLSGEKYHAREDCPGLRSAQKIEPLPLDKAEREGYTPCTRCCENPLPSPQSS